MPRFVILQHEMPKRPTHWDFMLEQNGVLRTWALELAPAALEEMSGRELADHRIAYLTYEGPVSGDRGNVTQWDCGAYEPLNDTGDSLSVELSGQRLHGTVELRRDPENDQRWIFRFSG